MISLANVFIVYLIGMVILGVLIKIIDAKGIDEFRDWDGNPNLELIALIFLFWPIIIPALIIWELWTLLWSFILPKKKYEDL